MFNDKITIMPKIKKRRNKSILLVVGLILLTVTIFSIIFWIDQSKINKLEDCKLLSLRFKDRGPLDELTLEDYECMELLREDTDN